MNLIIKFAIRDFFSQCLKKLQERLIEIINMFYLQLRFADTVIGLNCDRRNSMLRGVVSHVEVDCAMSKLKPTGEFS